MSKLNSAGHERPRDEWIEIPVPALVTEESFARAQELLQENKVRAKRRTITPSIVQGLVSCQKCGYAFSRTSTQSSARKLHYYKCIGSDGWRKLGGPVCDNARFVRQDLLDQIVWSRGDPIARGPDADPTGARSPLGGGARVRSDQKARTESAEGTDPCWQRASNGFSAPIRKISCHSSSCASACRRCASANRALRAELQAIADQANDRADFLRLAETLTAFLARLRSAADTLDVMERQRIVRLVVKEVLIGDDTIIIRHCIPVPSGATAK